MRENNRHDKNIVLIWMMERICKELLIGLSIGLIAPSDIILFVFVTVACVYVVLCLSCVKWVWLCAYIL